MANRWGNNGNSNNLIWGGSKVTADGDCSHEIKRCLFLGRKAMTNQDSILKSRDITFLTKAVVFPVVIYGCDSWTIKLSTEELMLLNCGVGENSWESFGLQVHQTGQSSRKSVLNVHWRDWYQSSNTLATWYEELTNWTRPWCWKILKAGEGNVRGWDSWMASPTWLSNWTEALQHRPKCFNIKCVWILKS